METAHTLYNNILALFAVVLTALIVAGLPLFYGIAATIDVALIIGFFAGTVLTLNTVLFDRYRKVARAPRRVTQRKPL